jgi:hypothetical protein
MMTDEAQVQATGVIVSSKEGGLFSRKNGIA